MKKLKKPKLKLKAPKLPGRLRRSDPGAGEPMLAPGVPRITNETVTAHRAQVLSRARKYVFPLEHPKHRIVKLSISLVVVAVLVFFVWCAVELYHFQSTSEFIYNVTRVVPFPVAKAGPDYVSYESYLFELRHNIHYYETQQQVNFSTSDGAQLLTTYKEQALRGVIDDAYVKQLAIQHRVSVSDREVDDEVALVRSENRLGSSQQVFEDVLNEFWGWSVDDFERELKQELLAQKVVAALDTATNQRAQQALSKLNHGAAFEAIAKQMSDDPGTKGAGGQYQGTISESDRDIAPQVAAELLKLKPGQHSGIINSGYSLEIVKVISRQGDKVKAAHIEFDFKDISTFIKPLEAKQPSHKYLHV